MSACHACLRRMDLLEKLAPRIEQERSKVTTLMESSDLELITLLGGVDERDFVGGYAGFRHTDSDAMREVATAQGLMLICQHSLDYPERLRSLGPGAPAVLVIKGDRERLMRLNRRDAVAIVGTRRATRAGLATAQRMARDLTAAGMTVVSGMAYGIDSAAHEGALEVGGPTIAVLPISPERPYPKHLARLHERILQCGLVLSELRPDPRTWRWALQARNRIIAGLAAATVIIEAPERSGALITVGHTNALERWVGVVPGAVGITQTAGTNRLLAKRTNGRDHFAPGRVRAVRHAQDVLDLIYGEGAVVAPSDLRTPPTVAESALLARISAGQDNVTQIEPTELADLVGLELKGWVARGAGGTLTVLGA